MRKALTLLTALAALVACGEEDRPHAATQATTTASEAPTTTSAAPTTPPAEDVAAQSNCFDAGLTYAPIASALQGDGDLAEAVQYAGELDLDPATTQPGKDANVALAELALEIAMAKAAVVAGQPVDRAPLLAAYTVAQAACRDVGII